LEHVSNYQLCSKSVLCDAVIDPHLAPTIPNGSDVRLKFKWISADRTSAATCLLLVFNPPYQGMDQRRLCECAAVFPPTKFKRVQLCEPSPQANIRPYARREAPSQMGDPTKTHPRTTLWPVSSNHHRRSMPSEPVA
jgi:hypothetical protein